MFERRFWSEAEGMVVEVWDRPWSALEEYRGANANMHSVEALLAVHDVTGSAIALGQATRIAQRLVHDAARAHGWLMPEHFTPDWQPLLDYNREEPAHPFRPYGATVGHLLEWSRLALHLRRAHGESAPAWLLDDARSLFDTAVRVGWEVDDAEGFVYTVDFAGTPVVRTRLHWVLAEGIAAACALWAATGEQQYVDWYARWWDHAERLFIDRERGSWRHELDPQNRPASTVWQGKPDVYHAYRAALLPELERSPPSPGRCPVGDAGPCPALALRGALGTARHRGIAAAGLTRMGEVPLPLQCEGEMCRAGQPARRGELCEREHCRAHPGHARARSLRRLGRPSPRRPWGAELATAAAGRAGGLVRGGHAGQPHLR